MAPHAVGRTTLETIRLRGTNGLAQLWGVTRSGAVEELACGAQPSALVVGRHLALRFDAAALSWSAETGPAIASQHRDCTSITDAVDRPPVAVTDALRRYVGLPTAPPTIPATIVPAAMWADAVLGAVNDDLYAVVDNADTVVALTDPILALVATVDADLLGVIAGATDPAAVAAELGRTFGESLTWDGIRAQAADGALDLLHPVAARWMDAGMFSRAVAAELDDLDETCAQIAAVAGLGVVTELRERLAARGWVPRS